MKTTLNYVSTVTIGRFNPAILTAEFLNNVCNLELGEGTLVTPPGLPFPKEILFKDKQLSFLVDLDRMQIQEKNVADIKDCVSHKYTKIYLEKLPYTPITLMGTNFNFTIFLEEENKVNFYQLLSSESELINRFKTEEFTLQTEKVYLKSELSLYRIWILTFPIDQNIQTSIRITLKDSKSSYEINHNIEAVGLAERPENKKFITDNYEKNLRINKDIIGTLLKGL